MGDRNATATSRRPAGCLLSTRLMARTLHLIVALLIVAALMPAAALAGGPAATRAVLASQMRSAGGGSGAFAIDLDSGRTIFASRAGTARTPASVEKLYTTSTALTLYGAEGHLRTRVLGGSRRATARGWLRAGRRAAAMRGRGSSGRRSRAGTASLRSGTRG